MLLWLGKGEWVLLYVTDCEGRILIMQKKNEDTMKIECTAEWSI